MLVLRRFPYGTTVIEQWKWQNMAEAGARARAKKWTNEEPEPKINNFGSATLVKTTDMVPNAS